MMFSFQDQSLLQSVQHGLQVLKLFTEEKPIWGITDISRELHIPKSTVSRLLAVLLNEGFIEKAGTKYRLGLSLLKLTGVIKSYMEIQREAAKPLIDLVDKIGETALISILEGANVIYLHRKDSNQPFQLQSDIGGNAPATCASAGKLLLSYRSKKSVHAVLQAGMLKMGPNSVTDPEQLLTQLKTIRKNGYCICINEMHEDVVSIAAPIKDYTGKVISAVSVIGSRKRIADKSIPIFIDEIVKTAQEISYRLGYLESISHG